MTLLELKEFLDEKAEFYQQTKKLILLSQIMNLLI